MRVVLSVIVAFILLCLTFLLFIRKDHTYNASARVHVAQTKDGFQLIRDGEPFEIKGASGEAAYLGKLKEMGGNTIRFYDTINLKNNLDKAHELGLSVIVDIPIPAYSTEDNPYDTPEKKVHYQSMVESIVSRYYQHPALLMWILGNEINFPKFGTGGDFAKYYNSLIDMVKTIDPDHPVTTAIVQRGRPALISLWSRTNLDLIAINAFGGLKNLKEDLDTIRMIWNGPFIISEWNDEGPWSEFTTRWGAPLEPTSSKKAERLSQTYTNEILPMKERCLGSLLFYWGYKHERTSTWFSIFLENGEMTPSYYALQKVFQDTPASTYPGPEIDFLMMNGEGPQKSILLTGGEINRADVYFNAPTCDSINISWEIVPEVWQHAYHSKRTEQKPAPITDLIVADNDHQIKFKTPDTEGPYRLFTYIKDDKGNTATANFPFYVINQRNVQQ